MRLVAYQEPVFRTIQGEGGSAGTLATFVRLWGCDFSCHWCDTKESWRPGSKYFDKYPAEVVSMIEKIGPGNVVFTGGNPLLQGDELLDVILSLGDGYTTTIETQGSVFHPVVKYCDLLSLSPKIHAGLKGTEVKLIKEHKFMCQVKIVVESLADIDTAVSMFSEIDDAFDDNDMARPDAYIIQPEYSKGRDFISKVCHLSIKASEDTSTRVSRRMRVMPQLHKVLFGVL